MQVKIDIDDPLIHQQLAMIQLTKEDLQLAKAIQPLIVENIESIVGPFYESILQIPHLKGMIQNNSAVDKLRGTLTNHMIEMFNGEINAEYIQKRERVAFAHVRIGLEPKWYMGAFQNLQSSLIHIITEKITCRIDRNAILQVISKLLNIEQQIEIVKVEKDIQELQQVMGEISSSSERLTDSAERLTDVMESL